MYLPAVARRGQIEEQCPRRLGRQKLVARRPDTLKRDIVGIVVCPRISLNPVNTEVSPPVPSVR